MAPSLYDIIRVVAKMSQAANAIQNVYHCIIEGTTAPDNATLLAAIASLIDGAYDYIDYAVADNVSFDTISVFNDTADEFVGETAWPTLTVGGGGVNPMLPPQNAQLVLFTTVQPGSLGKKFLPPMTDNVLDDDGTPVAGVLANALLYGGEIVDGVDGGTYSATFGTWNPTTFVFNKFTEAVARDMFATMRSRYIGKGS